MSAEDLASVPSGFQIGDAVVQPVTETVLGGWKLQTLLPDGAPELLASWQAAQPSVADLVIRTWVVRWRGRTVLIDTGLGNFKNRPFNALFHQLDNPFLARLASAGVTPESVDAVLHTHLHVDHVGWNTVWEAEPDLAHEGRGRWRPTFPNAVHVMPQAELDFFASPAGDARRVVYEDSVRPVLQTGQVQVVAQQGGEVLGGFRFVPTPGHCVGHMAIEFESGGERAVFSGDVMHSPVQVASPQWSSLFCADREEAARTRRRLLADATLGKTHVFPAHFAGRGAGRIERQGDAFCWRES